MKQKLEHIRKNGARARPDTTPTIFTEEEINSYIASGELKLPQGVESLRFEGLAGQVTASARIDFDQIKSGGGSFNPLLAVFSGVHEIVVSAHANGASGQGFVHIDSVSLDGVEIPRFALQLFVEKYIQPKYRGIGLDSQFRLPDRVDTAVIGEHILTITQR